MLLNIADFNNIGANGCKLLSKAGISSIQWLNIGIFAIMKRHAILVMKELGIWQKYTGQSYHF